MIKDRKFSFYISEISGALGDLPLFFIFFVGLTQFSDLNPLSILFWSGLAHIIVGFIFGVPLPYQPMKAMGLFAIAHGVSQPELLSAGLMIGIVILVLNAFGIFEKIYTVFPVSVIRGIQLGLALMLFKKSYELLAAGGFSFMSIDVLGVLAVLLIVLFLKSYHFLFILGIFGLALSYMFTQGSIAFPSLSLSADFFSFHGAQLTWNETVLTLIIIQLPLTTANSIFSPALLLKDYFPHKNIKASHIATSVGLINLLTCPLGGMPACHGAGGLAAQYQFGARTGFSVIFLGVIKIIAALMVGGFLLQVAINFPKALLGLLFVFPAYDLSRRALTLKGVIPLTSLGATALTYVFWHAGWAMVVGCAIYFAMKVFEQKGLRDEPAH